MIGLPGIFPFLCRCLFEICVFPVIGQSFVINCLEAVNEALNALHLEVVDYFDRDNCFNYLFEGFEIGNVVAIFQLQACSVTADLI